MVDITEVVAQEIADNAAIPVHDGDTYFLHDAAKRTYAFLIIPHDRLQKSIIAMLARMTEENKVIIEVDHTDTPLYQSLIDLGVPRSQIIRAYAGKTEPEP